MGWRQHMEPGPGVDSVPAGGEIDVEGMRREGRGHRQGRVGRGLGRQRDRKKGINQHRLHSGNVGEASIKRAPFPGPGRLSPYPSTSFSYLLLPRLSRDPSEGLPTHGPPLQAQSLQLLIVMKQLEPGSVSFQSLQAGVRMQEDSLLQDREEATCVLLPGLLTRPRGKSHASPSSLSPFLPSFLELGILTSRLQMETSGSCDSLLPQTGIQEVLPKDPRVSRCLYPHLPNSP